MKGTALLTTFALTACGSPDDADPLDPYRWENRVILHDRADEENLQLSPEEKIGFEDRDLVFLEAEKKLRSRFDLKGEKPVFVLIGKDGKEKARQSGKLDLRKWFALIDTMPMRQREMAEERPAKKREDE